jgi:glycosyltransferase involved in cell wall biosynthesis
MKKRLAIVSSYNEECGAAFYSSRLLKHLIADGYEVEVKRLPVALLRTISPYIVRHKADLEIKRIASEIREYDAVLFQFEPGLYGAIPKLSYPRVLKLIKAAKNAILTVHGFDRQMTDRYVSNVFNAVVRGRPMIALAELLEGGIDPYISSFWEYVYRSPHIKVMTFNRADQILLQRFFDLNRITHYPITYYAQDEVEQIREEVDREQFLRRFGLDPSRKYFAVFGFLSWYKGHLTAMKALEFLPEDWHLAIIGGEHPQALEGDRDIGAYVRQILAFSLGQQKANGIDSDMVLLSGDHKGKGNGQMMAHAGNLDRLEIKEHLFKYSEFKYFLPSKELHDRIHYLGQVSDEDMPKFYAAMDYAVHPYVKTKSGQSGSGPATFALEFKTRSLFSNAPVFREMNLYFKDAMHFFNVGNFIELAESLQRFDRFHENLQTNLNTALQTYNPRGMVDAYRQLLEA